MIEVILIRHFPTLGNGLGQYIGTIDEELDRDALQMIIGNHNIKVLERRYPKVDCIVTSPLKRCIQTAQLIYPEQKPILCHDLRECDFGLFEGKNYEELKDLPAYQVWLGSGGLIPFPNGESKDEFQKRCVRAFDMSIDTLIEQNCQSAAFVVHGGTIMAVLSAFDRKKRDFYHWQVKNGQGYTMRIEEETWICGKKYVQEIRQLCFM